MFLYIHSFILLYITSCSSFDQYDIFFLHSNIDIHSITSIKYLNGYNYIIDILINYTNLNTNYRDYKRHNLYNHTIDRYDEDEDDKDDSSDDHDSHNNDEDGCDISSNNHHHHTFNSFYVSLFTTNIYVIPQRIYQIHHNAPLSSNHTFIYYRIEVHLSDYGNYSLYIQDEWPLWPYVHVCKDNVKHEHIYHLSNYMNIIHNDDNYHGDNNYDYYNKFSNYSSNNGNGNYNNNSISNVLVIFKDIINIIHDRSSSSSSSSHSLVNNTINNINHDSNDVINRFIDKHKNNNDNTSDNTNNYCSSMSQLFHGRFKLPHHHYIPNTGQLLHDSYSKYIPYQCNLRIFHKIHEIKEYLYQKHFIFLGNITYYV